RNDWENYGDTDAPVSYTKNDEGWVTIRGAIKGGVVTNNTVLFVLPVGYRPLNRSSFTIHGATQTPVELVIWENGEVKLNYANATSTVLNAIFRAEQ
ncbi:hypothetical protein, partial [Streptomyces turgidiscabies]|uniref:hypothetical protein n=1 Tax=Streptomyces turgidiscabies TaxID=85558 RepID=UPI0031D1B043